MKLNSLILFHVRNIKNLHYTDARNYLLNKGFNQIGSGCESVVYSRKGFDYVIKLQSNAFSESGMHSDIPDSVHFIPTKVIKTSRFNIIIQQKVEHTVGTYYKKYQRRYQKFRNFMEKKFNCSDIHDHNIGIVRGRMVVFDWNYDNW